MKISCIRLVYCLLLIWPLLIQAQDNYRAVNQEALRESPAGGALGFKILVDAANLGGEETRMHIPGNQQLKN